MARWDQYEIYTLVGERWDLVASFAEFDVASAVARTRNSRMRLVHAVFQDGAPIERTTIMELGSTREAP
jgi:hypothetical protein